MRVTCPACNAESSLEVLIGREADVRAVAGFLERHLPMGESLLKYIALFRPAKRRLGLARMVALIEELMPDIERQSIDRKGRPWRAEPRAWRAAFDVVLAARDKGTLQLPLTSHGYLYEVLVGLAEKAEAAIESQRESERQRPAEMRERTGPRDLSKVATELNSSLAATPSAPPIAPRTYTGPSRAALEIRAQIERSRQPQAGAADEH